MNREVIEHQGKKIRVDKYTVFVYEGEEYAFADLFRKEIEERRREKLKNLLVFDQK